jgi:hypothetical protein
MVKLSWAVKHTTSGHDRLARWIAGDQFPHRLSI